MKTVSKFLALFLVVAVVATLAHFAPAEAKTVEKTLVTHIEPTEPWNCGDTAKQNTKGFAGMQITVGNKDLHVTAIGRWYTPQSNKTHKLMI